MTKEELKIYTDSIQTIYYNKIKKTKDKKDLEELYKYIKKIIPILYINNKMIDEYKYIIYEILKCERLLKEKYIIESKPINIKELNNYNELDLIVHETREYMSKKILPRTKYKTMEELKNKFSFVNFCTDASRIIKKVCEKREIKAKIIILHPGYSRESNLYNGYGLHAFNIVTYKNENYILDITYRQFFESRNNIFERVDILDLDGCKAGLFMTKDKKKESLAQEILTKGYIKLTEENLKLYLDGFTMSYRNGLYYDKVGYCNFFNGYDIETYCKFLKKEDNQINHEGREVLGYQKKPSKNTRII